MMDGGEKGGTKDMGFNVKSAIVRVIQTQRYD